MVDTATRNTLKDRDALPPEAAVETSCSEDTHDDSPTAAAAKKERASELLRPSIVPNWLKELEDQNDAFDALREKDAPSNPQQRDSMMPEAAPEWLKEFEQEQKKLLDALTKEKSVRFLVLQSSDDDDESVQDEADPPATAVAQLDETWDHRPMQQHRESVTPEWLLGFEAEQKKLLNAMKSVGSFPTSNHSSSINPMFQDSFAMMEDEELDLQTQEEALAAEAAARKKNLEQQQQQQSTEKAEESSKKDAVSSRALPAAPEIEEEKKETTPDKAPAAKRKSSMAVPDWLLEFENNQNQLFRMLDQRASVFLGSSESALEQFASGTAAEEQAPPKASNARPSIRPSIAPDFLEEFENQQKQLLEELHSLHQSTPRGLDHQYSHRSFYLSGTSEEEEEEEEEEEKEVQKAAPTVAGAAIAAVAKKAVDPPSNEVADKETKDTALTPEAVDPPSSEEMPAKADEDATEDLPTNEERTSLTPDDLAMPAPAVTEEQIAEATSQLTKTAGPKNTAFDYSKPNKPTEYQTFHLRKSPPRPPPNTKVVKAAVVAKAATDNSTTPKNEFQSFQLRKYVSPTAAQKNIAESKLQFAEMVAKAITPKANATPTWEALRHVDTLKLKVTELEHEQAQIDSPEKLHDSLLAIYDKGDGDYSRFFLNWLLPSKDRGERFSILADADAAQLAKLKAEEFHSLSGMGIVKKVLELNFKAIDGLDCLQTIHDYARFKFGKKEKKQRDVDGWEAMLAKLFQQAEAEGGDDADVHLRVRNSVVCWVVREILYTSRDDVSSRMCFHATFLVATLKLELQRVAPAILEELSQRPKAQLNIKGKTTAEPPKPSGRLQDAPDIVKKLLNREQSGGPNDQAAATAPLDLAPHDEGMNGSDKVDFVRETIAKREEDTMEEQARITSRASTFVRLEAKPTNDMDESRVENAVNSYKPPTNYDLVLRELMASRRSPSFVPPTTPKHTKSSEKASSDDPLDSSKQRKSTDSLRIRTIASPEPAAVPSSTDTSATAVAPKSEGEEDTSVVKEDESELPLPVQDAHRVIRTILGPHHPTITVSHCFEALRMYAALIHSWKEVGEDKEKQQPAPTTEEAKVKSLEGSVFRGDTALPAFQLGQELEAERKKEMDLQKEEEQRARESIARHREEKKQQRKQRAKKGNKRGMQDVSEVSHGSAPANSRRKASATKSGASIASTSTASKQSSSPAKSSPSRPRKTSSPKNSASRSSSPANSSTSKQRKTRSRSPTKNATDAPSPPRAGRKSILGKLMKSVTKSPRKKKPGA